jgi:hypothetical protein
VTAENVDVIAILAAGLLTPTGSLAAYLAYEYGYWEWPRWLRRRWPAVFDGWRSESYYWYPKRFAADNGSPLPDGWRRGSCSCGASDKLVNADGRCVDCAA